MRVDGFTILAPVVAADVRGGDPAKATRLLCVLGEGGSVEVWGESEQGGRVLHAEGSVEVSVGSAAVGAAGAVGEPDWSALS